MSGALLERSVCLIFNSDTTAGAENVSADGSSFQVTLDNPIRIPHDAVDCSVGVLQANIWNTSPNISAAAANNIFTFTTSSAPAGTYNWAIPDGLYSVAGLNSYLSSQFVNIGLPANLITISGNQSTQKSIITFLTAADSVDFTVANSVRQVLGFNAVVITAPSANYSFFSNNTAAFNRVNSYVISSNLVGNGIPVNSSSRGIIATVPINVSPGSQINYSPQNVIWFNAPELIGSQRSNMQFALLDEDLRVAATGGNPYAFTIMIKYHVLLSTGVLPLRPN